MCKFDWNGREREGEKLVSELKLCFRSRSDRSDLKANRSNKELTGDSFLSDRSDRVFTGCISNEYKHSLH